CSTDGVVSGTEVGAEGLSAEFVAEWRSPHAMAITTRIENTNRSSMLPPSILSLKAKGNFKQEDGNRGRPKADPDPLLKTSRARRGCPHSSYQSLSPRRSR